MTKAELIDRIARSRDLPPDISKKLIGQVLGLAFDELASYFARARVTRSQSPRFTFPPAGEGQAVYNVRVESYSQDNRSLFLENVGTFGRPVAPGQIEELVTRFGNTYEFLQDHLVTFVSQFDTGEH